MFHAGLFEGGNGFGERRTDCHGRRLQIVRSFGKGKASNHRLVLEKPELKTYAYPMRRQFTITPWIAVTGLGAFLMVAQDAPTPPTPPAKTKTNPATKNPKPPKNAPATPGTTGSDRYFLEQIRQLRGEMEELKGAYNLQIRKVMALETEVRALRTANETLKRENALKFASNKSIDELAAKLMELDKNRLNDLDVINKQIDAILQTVKKLAAAPPVTPRHNGGTDPAPANFKAREHVVQSGEFLSTILAAYNSAFKAEGLSGRVSQSQVLKANPGLDPNRLLVGQKLLIPLPGEIK